MKTSIVYSLMVGGLLLTGCHKEETAPAPGTATTASKENDSIVTAPVDYLARVGKAEQSMEKKIDTASLNNAVELFNAQEGRYPKDLNELVEKKYLGKLPAPPVGMKFQYDAKEGKVTVVKQ